MMNKLFKRNQLIITALAALVAVAGYLSFGDTKKEAINTSDLSDADVLAQIDAGEKDVASNDVNIDGTPGDAILFNATKTADYIVSAKLDKEYLRAKLMEDLLEIVNNTSLSGEEKKQRWINIRHYHL